MYNIFLMYVKMMHSLSVKYYERNKGYKNRLMKSIKIFLKKKKKKKRL